MSVVLPKVYFHHIPKTAGTSFRSFLVANVGARNVSPRLRGVKYRDAMRDYARFQVIAGHVEAVPGDGLPDDRISATLLRDPVERALSQFFFFRNVYILGARKPALRSVDLDTWIEQLDDAESEQLNGHLAALWAFGWSKPTIPGRDEKVAAAKAALDRFDVIGLQSRFEESASRCAARIGWNPGGVRAPRENVTPGRIVASELPAQTMKRLRDALAADYEVYSHAVRLFQGPIRRASQAKQAALEAEPEVPANAMPAAPPAAESSATVGTAEIEILAISVEGVTSGASSLCVGEWASIEIHFRSTISENDLAVGIAIRDHGDALVFGTNTRVLGDMIAVRPGEYSVGFRFFNSLGLGTYSVTVAIHRGESHLERCYQWIEHAATFDVIDRIVGYFEGRVRLEVEAHAAALSPEARITVSPGEIEARGVTVLGRRNSALVDFAATLSLVAPMPPMQRGADALVSLRITNTAREVWPAFGRRPVRVSYHWLDRSGKPMEFDGLRTPLPYDVQPAASLVLACFLRLPDAAGHYTLLWTLVQEEVAWFDGRTPDSSCACEVTVV